MVRLDPDGECDVTEGGGGPPVPNPWRIVCGNNGVVSWSLTRFALPFGFGWGLCNTGERGGWTTRRMEGKRMPTSPEPLEDRVWEQWGPIVLV
jgi:hypothetical protein